MPKFTPEALAEAAVVLDVDAAIVLAVAEVESAGSGYLKDGRLRILFERHVFSKRTSHRYDAKHPDVSNRKRGGYKGGSAEYDRLRRAANLDVVAALESASWGAFQIMGYHWKALGYESVYGMTEAFATSLDAQLDGFVRYIKVNKLDRYLREKRWTAFARAYNGPGYAQNQYDQKLARAYQKYVDQPDPSRG